MIGLLKHILYKYILHKDTDDSVPPSNWDIPTDLINIDLESLLEDSTQEIE